ETEVEILGARSSGFGEGQGDPAGGKGGITSGEVMVRHTITSYVRKRYFSEAVLEERPLDLPEISYRTQAVWFSADDVPDRPAAVDMAAALHALEHTLIQLLPAFVLCERADVGGVSYPLYPATGGSMIFVYDGYPGGVGYAHAGAE